MTREGVVRGESYNEYLAIRYFLMLVATGSFSPERGLPVIFCVDFNHFKSIIMSTLLHRKTLICLFLNQFRLLFICYQRKFNLLNHLYEFVTQT